jgi:hypothetical protein
VVPIYDGKKVWANHSCNLADGLRALGIAFETREVHPEGIEDEFGRDDSFWTGCEFPSGARRPPPTDLGSYPALQRLTLDSADSRTRCTC